MLLAIFLTDACAASVSAPPPGLPEFSLTVNASLSSGFSGVSTRADGSVQFALPTGGEGNVSVTVTSHVNYSQGINLILSLVGRVPAPPSLPPGITVDYQPSPVSLPPHENRTARLIISVDARAPAQAYLLYLSGQSDRGVGVGIQGFWLVVGQYRPTQSFSLIDTSDHLAKNETWTNLQLPESDSDLHSPGYLGGSPVYLTFRSEGPALDIQLSIINIDVPNQIMLSLQQSDFHVDAGAQGAVALDMIAPFGTKLGTYQFQVLAIQGNEQHVAHFNLTVVPLPPHASAVPSEVLINRTVSGYQFNLYIAYRWVWTQGHMTNGTDAGLVYSIIPVDGSLSSSDTYASANLTLIDAANSGNSLQAARTNVLSFQMMQSDAPRESTLTFARPGTYNLTVTGYARQANGTLRKIGSTYASFEVVNPGPSTQAASSMTSQTPKSTTGLSTFQVTSAIIVVTALAIVSLVFAFRKRLGFGRVHVP